MKIKLLFVAFLVSTLIASCPLPSCAMGGPMGHDGGKKMVERLAKDLALTKEQKEKLVKMTAETDKQTNALEAKNGGLFDKMQAEIEKDKPDTAVISKLLNEIGKNRTEAEIKRLNTLIEFKKCLTPEQVNRFKEIRKRQEKHFKERVNSHGLKKTVSGQPPEN